MSKTSWKYIASVLLVLMFVCAPFGILRAAPDDASADVSVNYQTVQINSITNKSDKKITSWTVTIKGIPPGAVLAETWCADVTLSGDTLTFTCNQDWNKEIDPKSTNTNISAGCNINGVDPNFKIGKVTVKATYEDVKPPKEDPKPGPGGEDPKPGPGKEDPKKPDPTATPTPAPTAAPTAAPTSAPTTTTKETTATTTTAETTTETTLPPTDTFPPMEWIVEPGNGDDWLTTDGNKIVDMNGTQVWLTGINWFGYNTGTNIFDGCWSCNMASAIQGMADRGFNLLRIPISAELVLNWKNGVYPTANFNQATNPELVGKNSLQIFDYAIALCQKYGMKVMLDIHSADTDASGHMTNLWYTDKVSLQDYYDALAFLADRFKDNDTVIAYDLKNEPHGKPGEEKAIWNNSEVDNNWKHVAEVAGNIVLDANPHALIMIEGIEIYPKDLAANGDFASGQSDDYYFNWWGGNLRGVKDYPIDFGSPERNKQIVYSPHDYGPAVYAQPWFEGDYTYESLKADCWNENWLYIHNENIAPILIGEWGGYMTEPNLTWMTDLRQLIGEQYISYTFWCYNANSGDTGGLVLDDFSTWDEEKYAFVNQVLWQYEGHFVGLDHAVPLGENGIALKDYDGELVPLAPEVPETEPTTTETTPPETTIPEETTAAPTTAPAAAPAAKKSKSSVWPTVKYILLVILIVLVGGGAFLFFKCPKVWNRIIDKLHLPKACQRVIPGEIWAENVENKRFKFNDESISKNNEFAGRYRPVKKEAAPSKTSAAKTEPAKPSGPVKRPNMRPAANKPKVDPSEKHGPNEKE